MQDLALKGNRYYWMWLVFPILVIMAGFAAYMVQFDLNSPRTIKKGYLAEAQGRGGGGHCVRALRAVGGGGHFVPMEVGGKGGDQLSDNG